MSQKHQNDQKCQKHEKRPKMTKNSEKWPKIAKIAKTRNIITVVDNTFCSPYIQRPLENGIDVVIHSVTKYINGHSDMVGGIVVTKNPEIAEALEFLQNAVGSVPSPFDCYLLIRSIKTLGVRMERHNSNAILISEFLKNHPKVKTVRYPGLKSDPNHELATSQMNGYGGIISIELDTDLNGTLKFLENIEIFTLAESLGGVESLIEHPALMTHASLPAETRKKIGITDGLIRLSVGIETLSDLIEDIEQALN